MRCFGPAANISLLDPENTAATMMYLLGLICFSLMLTAEARVGNSSEIKFCKETRECLHYDLICQTEDYEVRQYQKVYWVSTEEMGYFMEYATYTAFNRLYKYITGENDMGVQIEMTAPVLIKVEKTNIWRPDKYTVFFLLPSEYQRNPPTPTNERVHISYTSALTVYVKIFGGWVTTFSSKLKHYLLSCALDSHNAKYHEDFHLVASYNSPMTMMNRHNEIWILATDEPKCGIM